MRLNDYQIHDIQREIFICLMYFVYVIIDENKKSTTISSLF